jgi:hypothetical protein
VNRANEAVAGLVAAALACGTPRDADPSAVARAREGPAGATLQPQPEVPADLVIGWMGPEDARVWIEPAVASMGVGEAIPAPEPWSSEAAAALVRRLSPSAFDQLPTAIQTRPGGARVPGAADLAGMARGPDNVIAGSLGRAPVVCSTAPARPG